MKLKKRTLIISLVLAFILCLSFVLTGFLTSRIDVNTREINVNEIGTISYEEKAKQILESYDDYEIQEEGESIVFQGSLDISDYNLSGIQYLSTEADTTTKLYKTKLDMENETFYITTQYIQDGVVVHEENTETTPYYDEYSDDYYIAMPDGTNASMAEFLTEDNMNQCSVTLAALGIALTTKEAIVLLASVAIVAAPVVTKVVKTVVTTVVTFVRSIWSWFRSLFTKTTTKVYTQTVTSELSYSVTVSNTRTDARPFTRIGDFQRRKYYVAIADTDDGLLYVSRTSIDNVKALAILTTSQYVSSVHNGSNKRFVISLYTREESDARLIAEAAGQLMGSAGAILHTARRGTGYFSHYHPGARYDNRISKPHVFFGTAR